MGFKLQTAEKLKTIVKKATKSKQQGVCSSKRQMSKLKGKKH
jgi:hypothetical protein